MTEETLKDIKNRYPSITPEEAGALDQEEFNKMSISLLERLIKDCKEMLQDVFKSGRNWDCSEEDLNWLKDFIREQKNTLESAHKETVANQKNLREGLNPPFCYIH